MYGAAAGAVLVTVAVPAGLAWRVWRHPTLVQGVPANVVTICRLTWMCTSNDDHPNDAGYALIAATVVAQLA